MLCRSAWLCPLLLSWLVAPSLLLAFICTEYEFYSCIQLPKKQSFAKSVHYIYLIACCYSKARFLLYILSNQKCFMWKIVSKALTNLMAHFIFLLIRSLNHCDYLSTPGFLIPDAGYAIHRNPRITIFARHNRLDIVVHHPLETIHMVLHK